MVKKRLSGKRRLTSAMRRRLLSGARRPTGGAGLISRKASLVYDRAYKKLSRMKRIKRRRR